ncbi:MAG TPA: malto-oligosyltrehalose trehalohydrolase [Pirellulales bacterium]
MNVDDWQLGGWQLGASPLADGSTRFLVWAPKARRVHVHLLGAAARYVRLKPLEQGYHAAVAPDVPHGTRYLYRLDGRMERPDPASHFQPEGVHGPSEVVDPAFDWHDAGWRGPALADYVVYELHVGTFSPSGTFAGVIDGLDELVELGMTAVELMPLAEFPGSRNWGYDGVYPFAVQSSYGGPRELKRLVDACHGRGLAVVLDVVYNHIGPEGNYLADFGRYFSHRHHTPWGPAINFEGAGSDEVRRYFVENALRWTGEFHFDALRLDAIHAIVDQSADPFLAELTRHMHAAAGQRAADGTAGRPAYLIAETSRNDPRIFETQAQGGPGLDAQWLDDFGRAVEAYVTGNRTGFYADYGRLSDVARAYEEGYVLAGQYSHYRHRHHGQPSVGVPPERFLAYLQTHDQVGNRPHGARLCHLVTWEPLKLATAALLLSPYPPLLFMGEEYAETAPFHFFVSHGDPQLVERVRAGRRREFAALKEEPVDPQAESTFHASRLDRSLRQQGRHQMLWQYYRELLRLRREMPALCRRSREKSWVGCFEQERILLSRSEFEASEQKRSAAWLILSFNDRPITLTAEGVLAGVGVPPSGVWRRQFDSAAEQWGGPGTAAADVWSPGQPLTLAAHNAVLYVREEA